MNSNAKLVLASSSPRRRELLARAGIRFAVIDPPPDQVVPPGMSAELVVQCLARQKAVAVAEQISPGTFVIAADTVVLASSGILGKPITSTLARTMLKELRGSRHTVLTGICAIAASDKKEALAVSRSTVKMHFFSDEDLETYIASREPLDKSGGYAVNGAASDFIDAVSGRVDTVVGLDVQLALRLLVEVGYPDPLPAPTDIVVPPPRNLRGRPLAKAAQRA